jgi:hypothetical protein
MALIAMFHENRSNPLFEELDSLVGTGTPKEREAQPKRQEQEGMGDSAHDSGGLGLAG